LSTLSIKKSRSHFIPSIRRESVGVTTAEQTRAMVMQQFLVPEAQRLLLTSLIGQTIGGVASEAPDFRDSWESWSTFFIEVDDQIIGFSAALEDSQDEDFGDLLAVFDVRTHPTADVSSLSTWYHWWKGETIEEVLLITDDVTVTWSDTEESRLLHDIGVVLICDVHAIAICLNRSVEVPNLIIGHERITDGRPGIHTHPGVSSLSLLGAEGTTHARSVIALSSREATS